MLCCSYNFRDNKCTDNVRPMGYDGMVASTASVFGLSESISESVETTTDANKQYNAPVRMAGASDSFNVSELQGIKTEKLPQPGG